jgi:hypothetical protein
MALLDDMMVLSLFVLLRLMPTRPFGAGIAN